MNISKKSLTVYQEGGVIVLWDHQDTFVDFIAGTDGRYRCAGSWRVVGDHTLEQAQQVAEDRSASLHRLAA